METVKLVVVGDCCVGKTALILTYTEKRCVVPLPFIPTVIDELFSDIIVEGKHYEILFYDTSGNMDYDRLRPLYYPGADVFLVCYSVEKRRSLENVVEKWIPEVKHHCPFLPIVLTACKIELRSEGSGFNNVITTEEGQNMAKSLGVTYCETSSEDQRDLPLENKICKTHFGCQVIKFCIQCEVPLCQICMETTHYLEKHEVRDVGKMLPEIHKRKDEDAVLMCLLLCHNYKLNLEETQWMEKYNAVAKAFGLKKIKKNFEPGKIKKYKSILKQDSSNLEFSCDFFRDYSFLIFAKQQKFLDLFLNLADKENVAKYCRSSNYVRREDEEEVCWLSQNQAEQLIERLGEDIFTHATMKDQSIHELVFSKMGIPVQVIMRGDDSVKNFLENLKRGKTTMHHATGMLIGCGGSGKSTLLERLKDINLEEIRKNTKSTRGIDIQTDVFDVSNTIKVNSSSQNQRFKVRIDEKSQHHHVLESPVEKFDEVKALDINDIHDPGDLKEDTASEAAYDEDSSQDSIDTEPESLKGNEAAAPVPVTREKSVEGNTNIAKHSESLGVLRVVQNGSDEPEKKISMVDFAGQCSYYSSHQLFLSPRAFFILVFNMEKQFDEMVGEEVCSQKRSIYKEWTHRDYVSFWAKNIHQYSSEKAPILLVGTHAEKMTEEEKVEFFREIWKTLETKDKSLQGHLDKNRAFAIGFHENESIEKIKESIVDVVQKLDHWGEKLPRSWAMFENFFQEKKYLKIINIRTLMAFNEALPSDIKLGSVEDINIMLLYFHDIRDILYFNQNVLKEVIILDIQWFADAFKNVITDKNHAKEDLLEFSSEWDQFDDTGELSDTLLSRIWKMNDNEYIEHKDEIMLYMEKLGLLVKMDDKNWYVPCMNKKTYPGNSFSSNPSSSILCFTFDVLPAGIFHRLVASCMQIPWSIVKEKKEGKEQPCIYQTAAVFLIGDHNVLLGMTPTEIQLQVSVLDGEIDTLTCFEIKEKIENELHILSCTFQRNLKFHVAFKCKRVGFCDNERSHVIRETELTEPTLQCPYCNLENKHVIITKEITKYWKQAKVSPSRPALPSGQNLGDRSRFAKLGIATNDVLNQAYRDILELEVPPSLVYNKVIASSIYKNLRPEQENILLDAKHSGYKNFDISLMYTLIRNICVTIPKPTRGKWGKEPAAGEVTVGDDIERIRSIRNSLTAHVSSASTPQTDFDDTWSTMSDICQRLETFTGKTYLVDLNKIQKMALREKDEDDIIFKIKVESQHEMVKEMLSDMRDIRAAVGRLESKHVFS